MRLRTQAIRDLRKNRQQLLSFLLRHGRVSPFGHWTKMHRRWLGELVFAHPAQHLALEEMLQRIERAEALCDRLKAAILELVPQWSLAPMVQAIQALRGVSLIVAAVIVAEVGCFGRFESPRALMAYLGLNPSEHSSGATIRRGAITKTGNTLARTCLVKAAWTYRFPARVFKRPSVRYGATPEPETAYQRAGQAWDERIGSARVQAKNWRLAFFGMLALSGGLAAGLVGQSARGTVTPWVVEVDKLGRAEAVAPAVADYRPTDPEIAWHLGHFIEEVRSIPSDPVVLRQNWLDAYNYVTDKGALSLNDYARHSDPFAELGKTQVAVEVSSVIRASPSSFRVAWIERNYVDSALAATERWSAILTIVIEPPTDADRLRKNPLGVYVHALNWSKELG